MKSGALLTYTALTFRMFIPAMKAEDTQLLQAAREGHEPVKLLIESGADIEAQDDYDRTPWPCDVGYVVVMSEGLRYLS
ncbi:hypothetical protein GGI35DRAFT_463944 [Trichoderma velutinum]